MLAALKSLIADLEGRGDRRNDLAEDECRVACAALLVHAGSFDGEFSAQERDRLRAVLKQRFDLDDTAADALIARAEAAEQNAVDIYHFTRLLNRSLDEQGRLRLIEMMWQIAYEDGHPNDYESNLIWRTADLLGVSQHERIALRERVASEHASGGA